MKNETYKKILDATPPETDEDVAIKTDIMLWQSVAKELAEALENAYVGLLELGDLQEGWEPETDQAEAALQTYKTLTDEH